MEGYAWGGSEELWSRVALRLAERGYTIAANVRGWPETPPKIQKLEQAGIQVTKRADYTSLMGKVVKRVTKPVTSWLTGFNPDFVVIFDGANYGGDS